jgi:hypothetical protein
MFAKRLFEVRSKGGIDDLGIGVRPGILAESSLDLDAKVGKYEKKENILADDVKRM